MRGITVNFRRRCLADIAGVGVLGVLVAIAALFVSESILPKILWLFLFVIISIIGLWLWAARQSPETPMGWLFVAAVSIVAAGVWYGISRLLSVLLFSGHAQSLSENVDLSISFMICPGLTGIAIAGWVRALVLRSAR